MTTSKKTPTLMIAGGTDVAQQQIVKIPRSLRMEEILAIRAPDTIIKGRLPSAGLVFIYGPPKSGKTFFALDMCMSLARGESWHGTPTRQTGVLYIAGEGVHGLGMRMLAYTRKHGHKPRTKFRAIPAAITLHESVAGIEEEIRTVEIEEGWRPQMLVLDTLARTKGELDENTGQMAHYIAAADHFIQQGMLVIVIHHPGKDAEKGMRGWSGLLGALDLQIQVVRDGDTVVARWTHAKDMPDAEPFPFRLSVVETGEIDGWGDVVMSCFVEPCDTPAAGNPRGRPTGDKQHLLHGLLGEMLKASTEFAQGGAPSGRPCVSLEAAAGRWRKSVPGEGGERNKLNRTLLALENKGLIAQGEGWLWTP